MVSTFESRCDQPTHAIAHLRVGRPTRIIQFSTLHTNVVQRLASAWAIQTVSVGRCPIARLLKLMVENILSPISRLGDGDHTHDHLSRAELKGHGHPFRVAALSGELQQDVEEAPLIAGRLFGRGDIPPMQVVEVVRSKL